MVLIYLCDLKQSQDELNKVKDALQHLNFLELKLLLYTIPPKNISYIMNFYRQVKLLVKIEETCQAKKFVNRL
jgi:hypothetical protein